MKMMKRHQDQHQIVAIKNNVTDIDSWHWFMRNWKHAWIGLFLV
jgi:hypothetical protein